uniref:CCHC-type domain-containing protein n=1 Tax=Tanacetum cinerariifolium TaxID=118510 RepID=A0A699IHU7_TANCI|nr:hypothetical protein [Tanacetum cinerariifolium]
MLNKENYVPWSSRLLRLLEDIYAAVDSCETTEEIWLQVQQMMKGSDIEIQEKKAKLFNEWERFTSNEGESIESYYHQWSRHVTIVHQTKDLHTADYTQLYDFLKYNQKEVDELKAERLINTQDPLVLMANSNNPYAFLAPHQDQSSFDQNHLQQPMQNPEDITNPTTAMNMALALMAKAFKLNYLTPTKNNHMISSNPKNRQIAQPGMNMGQDRQMQMVGGNGGNQFRQYVGKNARNSARYNNIIGNQIGNGNLVAARADGNAAGQNGNQIKCYNYKGVGHYARNCTIKPRRRDAAFLQTQLLIAQKEEWKQILKKKTKTKPKTTKPNTNLKRSRMTKSFEAPGKSKSILTKPKQKKQRNTLSGTEVTKSLKLYYMQTSPRADFANFPKYNSKG